MATASWLSGAVCAPTADGLLSETMPRPRPLAIEQKNGPVVERGWSRSFGLAPQSRGRQGKGGGAAEVTIANGDGDNGRDIWVFGERV